MCLINDSHKKTQKDYDKGVEWHIQKSLSYNWSDQIDRFVKALHGNRVLDAGCGGGRDIAEFLKRGYQIDGLDYSGITVRKCRENFPEATFYEGDIRKMNLPNNEYDGLWVCASILNLKKFDVPDTLSEFRRVLKKDGQLFISVKEGEGERMVSDQAGERFFSFYSVDELVGLVRDAGFNVTHSKIVPDSDLTGKVADPVKPAWICLYAINS